MASNSNAPPTQAGQTWHHAMKVRKHLLKYLEKVQSENGIDLVQFEKIDSLLETLRLACVQTIFLDFKYAVGEKTENVLWTLHTSVNAEYRRALGKLKGNAHVVEKRKVEKMYQNFLRIAQKFYKGYVQRITARYDIKELKRIANGIEVEHAGADDMISPVPDDLNCLVLRSCHATLIRLGDLARYRVQAKYKKFGGFDSALTYYALANDLLPESGFGHHQMGIIQLDEGNQLEVVYRFYRAWATSEPHPNAKGNLESKLRDLRAPNTPAPRQVSATPRDTFSMWFIRLHALFYKGEPFSQHAELEGEVTHRLNMMSADPEAGDILLKAILINIAAFHVAGLKYAESKNDTDLQFARFTMALNARFITVICDVLSNELDRHAQGRKSHAETPRDEHLPQSICYLLPMLRIYMIWLASRRTEIFNAPEATGGLVPAMVQSLGRALTLLSAEATEHRDLASCPYLLAEDLEIRGLQPLEHDQVPGACRCYCNEAGDLKPRREHQDVCPDIHLEALARLLDILRVGYFFAEDEFAPLVYRIVSQALVFEYSPSREHPEPEANGSESAAKSLSIQSQTTATAPSLAAGNRPVALSASSMNALQPNEPTWSDFTNGDEVTNDQTENTVMSMLTPFLKPPTPQPAGHISKASETSYGLHTATAEDVFGSLPAQRSPGGSIIPTTFEQLPWGWLHTPTPQKGSHGNHEEFPSHSKDLNDLGGPGSPNGRMAESLQSPLAGRAPALSRHRPSAPLRSPLSPSSGDVHRNQLLQSFTGAGSAPRSSSFSHWSPEHSVPRPRQASTASPWALNANGSMPASSNISAFSAFSHPSSIYQGTPTLAMPDGSGESNSGGRGLASSISWQSSVPNERHRQLDNTTSSYNAAIFDAALKD